MNQEKAKEFFSSYYEGNLEPGLTQALEQALKADSTLRDDYRDFEQTYEELGTLKYETIEVPFDLEDRIAARIDRQLYDRRNERQPAWTVWLRNLAVGGVGAVALLGAVLSVRKLNGAEANANIIAGLPQNAQDELTVDPAPNHAATVHFQPSASETLTIRQGLNGAVRKQIQANGADVATTLENPTASPATFELEATGDTRPTLIILPGATAVTARKGQGNMDAFAEALAGVYNVPVEVRTAYPAVNLNWDFKETSAADAAKNVLDISRYNIDWRANGLLVITEASS